MKMFLKNIKESFKTLEWYEWIMAIGMVAIALYAMISAFISPSANGNPPWLTVVNFISAVCGVVCIFFCAKANISNFVFGIVNTAVYIVYLAYWKIYGTMALEILLYMPVNIISWVIWARHKDNEDIKLTKSKKLSAIQWVGTTAGVVGISVLAHFVLTSLVGSSWAGLVGEGIWHTVFTWIDCTTFAIGIVAVILEMLRYREQYIWWLITDVFAVAMYAIKFDPVYLTKKSIYLIMAVVGLINWVKLSKKNTENE